MSTSEAQEENSIDCGERRNVVITGFGLFRDHQLNPSWEAIKDGQLKIDRLNRVNIITKQFEVAYKMVDELVPALWKEYNPILMIHIGLAQLDPKIRIEQVARHGPYIHDDVCKQAPHKDLRNHETTGGFEEGDKGPNIYSCKPCKFECSRTSLNVDLVCDKLNKAFKEGKIKLESGTSTDAGLYVCEYIYQKSLRICDRCVFIHVPSLKNDCSLEDIRNALKLAIETLIDEVLMTH